MKFISNLMVKSETLRKLSTINEYKLYEFSRLPIFSVPFWKSHKVIHKNVIGLKVKNKDINLLATSSICRQYDINENISNKYIQTNTSISVVINGKSFDITENVIFEQNYYETNMKYILNYFDCYNNGKTEELVLTDNIDLDIKLSENKNNYFWTSLPLSKQIELMRVKNSIEKYKKNCIVIF